MSERRDITARTMREIQDWGWTTDMGLDPLPRGGYTRNVYFAGDGLEGHIAIFTEDNVTLHLYADEVCNEDRDSRLPLEEAMDDLAEVRDVYREINAEKAAVASEIDSNAPAAPTQGDDLPDYSLARRTALRHAGGQARSGNIELAREFAAVAVLCGADEGDVRAALGI